jgi:hypothetical protein
MNGKTYPFIKPDNGSSSALSCVSVSALGPLSYTEVELQLNFTIALVD